MTAADRAEFFRLLEKLVDERFDQRLAQHKKLAEQVTVTVTDDDQLDAAATAKLCGWPSRRAMDQAFHRAREQHKKNPAKYQLHEVEKLTKKTRHGRRWRRGDLLAYLGAKS